MAFYHELNTHFLPSSSSYDLLNRAQDFQPDDDTWHDDCHLLGEKKRRLSLEQVRALEKSFELGNKLDSERKTELARALGLQPRQVAIWFQNRRARWKNKQLENNYDELRRRIECVKSDNDALRTLNKKLHSQLLALKTRESTKFNLNKDKNGSDENLNTSTTISFYLHPSNENPSSIASEATLLQCSSSKIGHSPTSNEPPLCNVFLGVEDNNPGFWPWPGQQNFH